MYQSVPLFIWWRSGRHLNAVPSPVGWRISARSEHRGATPINTPARTIVATLGTVSVAFLVCWSPTASADTGGTEPPNCTGADFAGVSAGVAASMSTYLFTHPDVNAFITDLEANAGDQSTMKLVEYFTAHPQVKAETDAIRQPIADFDRRCGYGRDARL